ncbi:MAG: hypothetical protein K5765_05985 [Clostridia bacterium]|nr:hypothetical protein [Clostridia bacterium]
MDYNKWRFPASNHGEKKGISSGDTETFKKAPYQAFAREILQNSIDAQANDEEPVRVEFNLFEINALDIPGYDSLKDAIRRCGEFWHYKSEYVSEYKNMLNVMGSKKIKCLRISDFNTTGLIGVESTKQDNNKFLALAKGSGVSEKNNNSMAGGSKGVGKNAAILLSSLNTIIYSTRTNQDINGNPGNYSGSIGVAALVSGYVDDNNCDNRDYTQGTGYYSSDDLVGALNTNINLDPSFLKREREYGTDVYIVGFIDEKDWEKEVINSILNSFMTAIIYRKLEICINGVEISNDTIENIVYDDSLIIKNNKSNIISQYRILTNKDGRVITYDIDTGYGNCTLYVLPLEKSEDELATHKCTMVRVPYMKIKDENLGSTFRVSALCIIPDGLLGKKLRDIENAQHIDWELKRIKDLDERKEVQYVLNDIKQQIKDNIIDCLKLGDNEPLDPNGAGDFLPDIDNGGESSSDSSGQQKATEKATVTKPKENKYIERNANNESDNGNGLEPDIGDVDVEAIDGDVMYPEGENDSENSVPHPGDNTGGEKEGDEIIFKKTKLSNVKYNVISTDKLEGRVKVIFIAPIDYQNCYLNISLMDDSNGHLPVLIEELNCNGFKIESKDKREYGPFSIKMNQKIVLDVKTNLSGFFASEVKIICK